MVNPELKEELLSNDSLDVLVGTRFSSVRAGPVNSAVVLNSKQYWVCDIKGYGPIQCIMFHAQPFNFVRLGTIRHLLHSVPIINLFWVLGPLKYNSNMLSSWYTCAAETVAKDINGYWKKQGKWKMGFQVLETILNTKKILLWTYGNFASGDMVCF